MKRRKLPNLPSTQESPKLKERFGTFARQASRIAGHPVTFLIAVIAILAWAASGPMFNFNERWQLFINTGTTILIFLLVILIQNTQNRDALSLQVKLSELILAVRGARNSLAGADKWSIEELETMLEEARRGAERPKAGSAPTAS